MKTISLIKLTVFSGTFLDKINWISKIIAITRSLHYKINPVYPVHPAKLSLAHVKINNKKGTSSTVKLSGILLLASFFVTGALATVRAADQSVAEHGKKLKGDKDMVFIKGGCYQMGNTFDEDMFLYAYGEKKKHEKPVHEVCVNDYYLGEHEVTQGEWEEVMANNPSYFKSCGKDCPVEELTYHHVQNYIRKLNNKTGKRFRLPTEAEWEYAARNGGRKVRFGTKKDIIGPDEANFDGSPVFKKPYSRSGVFRDRTLPVKSFLPNSLGLYDMSGNVMEWVSDWYDAEYYLTSPRKNPKGPRWGIYRVLRGGSFFYGPYYQRAAYRYRCRPDLTQDHSGFRLAHDK